MEPDQSREFRKRDVPETDTTPPSSPLLSAYDEIPPLDAVWPGPNAQPGTSEPLGLLGRAKLERELTDVRSRAEKLQVLHDIGCAITSSLGLEELLTRIVEAAVYVTGAEEGSLLLLDDETRELELRAQKGLGDDHARGFRIQTTDGIAGEVVETNKPQRLESADQELKVVTGYLVKSILYVPVAVKSGVIGVLVVDNQTPDRPFSDDDENVLQILAGYAAIALENARLREELAGRVALGGDLVAPDAVHLRLLPDPEPLPAETSSPYYVRAVIGPYLDAISELQGILDELEGRPRREARILAIQPGVPVSVIIDGAAAAVQVVADMITPWKQAHTALLAEAAEKEGEATIETVWVDILEARARAAGAWDEREKVLAQAEQQRGEAARKVAEGRPLRTDVQWAMLGLASDLLAQLAPNLADGERLVRLVRLLPALEILVASPLALSTGA